MSTASRTSSLVRLRTGFAVAALALPLAQLAVFERQARRLDRLAAQGERTTARVTGVSSGSTRYEYVVGGQRYTWSVKRREAPYPVGGEFAAIYSPGDESLSRPGADRGVARAEATGNRSMAWKLAVGIGWFFGGFAVAMQRELVRARQNPDAGGADDAGTRARLVDVGIVLLPVLLLITGFHASDAAQHGQSLVPVALGLALTLAIIVGVVWFALRRGAGAASQRVAQLMRWLAPLAVIFALLRLAALWFQR